MEDGTIKEVPILMISLKPINKNSKILILSIITFNYLVDFTVHGRNLA